ncbi:MAG TPA: hypothetical protein VN414_10595 [Methanosarcina sp.]|nr:hypothetical protein [Methanosarcina sp.]
MARRTAVTDEPGTGKSNATAYYLSYSVSKMEICSVNKKELMLVVS